MKKNAIILGAGMLLAAGILAGCGTASTGKGSEGGSQGDGTGTLVLKEETGYLAQAVLSLDLLGGIGGAEAFPAGIMKAPDLVPGEGIASESQAAPTEKDLLAEEILLSAHSLGSLLSFSPGSVETLPSDREGYESLQVVTINDIDGTSETYSLYLNETVWEIEEEHDEWERTTRIEGIAIRDGVEYAVRGERSEEKERDEWETELELRIALDAKNYVEIEQSLEDNENEYEYTLVENGREVESMEYEFETLRNGKLALGLEREVGGEEFEITLFADEDGLMGASFEVEKRNGREIEGWLTLTKNPDGTTTYQVRFEDDQKVYEKIF